VQQRTWIAAFGLFTTFSVGVWLAEVRHERSLEERAVAAGTAATTRLLKEHAARALGAGDIILSVMLDMAQSGDLAPANRQDTFHRLAAIVARSPQIGAGWFLDDQGTTVVDTWEHPSQPGNYAFRDYFKVHRGGQNDLYIGPAEMGSANKRPRFTLSRPILSGGTFAGVAVVNVSADYFTTFYENSSLGPGSAIHLLTMDGHTLASWSDGTAKPPEDIAEALRTVAGSTSGSLTIGTGKDLTLVSFGRVEDHPVMVVTARPLYPALDAWRNRMLSTGTLVGAALIGFSLLMIMGVRSGRRERLALAELQQARADLERQVAERSAEAERRREDLHLVADALPALISYIDSGGRFRFVNKTYKTWFNRELNEFIGMRPAEVVGSEAFARAQPRHAAAQNGQWVAYDSILSLPDGTTREVEVQYIPHTGPDGQTGGFYAFAVDVTARRAAERALRDSERRYRRLFEAMDQGFAVHKMLPDGSDYRFLQVNPAFERLTGLTSAAVIGRTVREAIPGMDDAFIARYADVVRNERAVRFQEYFAPFHRWYETYAFPIGADRFATLFDDITERKQAEERQVLLMAELDHRVRNILASVQSMVLLTARSATTKEQYAEILRGRVAAMARAHGLLTQCGWRGARLDQIVRDELAPFAGHAGGLSISGPSTVMLKPKDALNFALVLHEMTTNAAKYGALSIPGGHIDVRWTDAAGALCLTWEESGGPPVTPPERRGFGSVLIESALGADGTTLVDLTFPPEGVRCTITLPRQRLLEPRDVAMAGQPPGLPMAMPPSLQPFLGTARILIVEDEVLVAMELGNALRQNGFMIVGPATTLHTGLTMATHDDFDAAVLDVNLNKDQSTPIADALIRRGIPFLFASGYDTSTILPPHLHHIPSLQKPVDSAELIARLRVMLAETLTDPVAKPPS